MSAMAGTGKTAWRLLAAVPFVLLLGIVGIKLTAGDPNSPLNNVPGVQTIYELGDDAPSTDVNAKLPKSKKPSPTASDSASDSASASASTSASPGATKSPSAKPTSSSKPSSSPKPSTTPKPQPTSSSPTTEPSPTPTRTLTAQEQCEAQGKHWRKNIFNGNWYCSAL
jgi:hypothetical protein